MNRGSFILFLLGLLLLLPNSASHAHEVRPGYLSLKQVAEDRFQVMWRVPARGERRLSLAARLPATCLETEPRSHYLGGGASTQRWSVHCPGGLAGGTLGVDGLQGTLTDVLVRVEQSNGLTQVKRLSPSESTFVVPQASSMADVAAAYGVLGVEHILLGVDHLLFVAALMLLVQRGRLLVTTITAFTVAHSLTLGAASLGILHVPSPPVEAVIALSIVFVATEIVRARQGRPGWTQRRPWLVAFIFGLLHGLGFAGALTEIGLPPQAVPLALLFFNLGVEAGQLLFIGGVLAVTAALRRMPLPRWHWAWRIPAYGIGSMAGFWVIERVSGFWG